MTVLRVDDEPPAVLASSSDDLDLDLDVDLAAGGGRSVWLSAVWSALPAVVVSGALFGWMLARSAAGANTAGLQMPPMDLQHRVVYWWPFLMGETLGISALIWSYLSVLVGLTFSARSLRFGLSRRTINTLHRHLSMTGLFLIAGHVLFVAVGSMNGAMTTRTVNVSEALLPFQTSWNATYYNVGVFSFYLAILLGPSYYLRRRLGSRAWRIVHRASIAVYVLAVWHTLGFDDFDFDGGYRLVLWLAQIPLAALLLWRLAAPTGSVRTRRRTLAVRAVIGLVAAAAIVWITVTLTTNGIGGSPSPFGHHSTAAAASSTVEDHVHGAVAGPATGSLLLATHYGLESSADGGRTWTADGGLGDEMIAGIVRTGGTYVASLQMMPGMSMPSLGGAGMKMSGGSMAGMNMSGSMSDMPSVAYSSDGRTWSSPTGFPAKAQVASIAAGTTPGTVWASVLGKGVFRSVNAGRTWSEVIPARIPINVLAAAGPNLLMATPSGTFVTSGQEPSMPGLPQLRGPVNDLVVVPGCAGCVVAARGTGGIAVSRNDGVTWTNHRSPAPFDELYAGRKALFGLVASAGKSEGIWRSRDDGKHWQRVLAAPLVDHMYVGERSGTSPLLLAFGWGIRVYRSTNDGRTWRMLTHVKPPA